MGVIPGILDEKAFGFTPSRLGTGGYGPRSFLTWLLARGVDTHIPVLDCTMQMEGMFTRADFTCVEI